MPNEIRRRDNTKESEQSKKKHGTVKRAGSPTTTSEYSLPTEEREATAQESKYPRKAQRKGITKEP